MYFLLLINYHFGLVKNIYFWDLKKVLVYENYIPVMLIWGEIYKENIFCRSHSGKINEKYTGISRAIWEQGNSLP